MYTAESCDACCGDCNVMKYMHSEEAFIAHCVRIAEYQRGKESFVGDEADAAEGAEGAEGAESEVTGEKAEHVDEVAAQDERAPNEAGDTAEAAIPNPFAEFSFGA